MIPLILIGVPLVLVIIGMVLNKLSFRFEEPARSPEENPVKRLEAERKAFRDSFDRQKMQILRRQRRTGQFGTWIMVLFVISSLWLYFDTVDKTATAKQVAAIQTMATEEGKDIVLSVTLEDGEKVKFIVKLTDGEAYDASAKNAFSKEKLDRWELSELRTALSLGDGALPLGVALKIID